MPVIDHEMEVLLSTGLRALEGTGPPVGVWGSEGIDGLGGKKPLPDWKGPSLKEGLFSLGWGPVSFSWVGPGSREFE